MFSGGASYYYHYDPLGSVVNLTSASGATAWSGSYEPYGAKYTETSADPNASANPMQFAAEYKDPTELYYLRARQYDPTSGRSDGPRFSYGALYGRKMLARLAVALHVIAASIAASGCGTHSGPPPGFSPGLNVRTPGSERPSPLTVVAAPTPRFQVRRYDTSGTYPQVRGSDVDLKRVNAALREAVLADQREFAPDARRGAIGTAKWYRGIYRTGVDRRLLSASTVVVSALMPATKQYPGGSLGKGWIATTVRVPSGAPVKVTELFKDPSRGLRKLASAWKTRFRRSSPGAWSCVQLHLSHYRPTPNNYRYFALTPHGLAVGFWQEAACNRLEQVVPYAILRPYLSTLGSTLVVGVRRPR